jgi:hypothetical protein
MGRDGDLGMRPVGCSGGRGSVRKTSSVAWPTCPLSSAASSASSSISGPRPGFTMTAPRGRRARVRRSGCFPSPACPAAAARRSRPSAAWRRARRPPRCGLDARDGFGRARPAATRKFSAASACAQAAPEDAKAQHGHRAIARQRRAEPARQVPSCSVDMRVHPEVVAQHVAGDPFHHAFGQPVIDHARQRHLERGVAGHVLDPGPEVQDRLEPV